MNVVLFCFLFLFWLSLVCYIENNTPGILSSIRNIIIMNGNATYSLLSTIVFKRERVLLFEIV